VGAPPPPAARLYAMDQKPHWLVTELAAISAVVLLFFISWTWQQSNSLEGVVTSADHHAGRREYDQAIALYDRAIATWKSTRRSENSQYADLLAALGSCYYNNNKDKQAEPYFVKALAIREKLLKPDDQKIGDLLSKLAYCYMEDKKYDVSAPLYKRAIDIFDRRRSRSDLLSALDGLAWVYYQQEKYAEAVPLYERELRIKGSSIGRDEEANANENLAACYVKSGQYDKAEPVLRRLVEYRQNHLPDGDKDLCSAYQELADCLNALGKKDEKKELEGVASEHKCSLRLQ